MPGEKMAKMASNALVVATFLSFVALPALSQDNGDENDSDQRQVHHGRPEVWVPEIENHRDSQDVSAPEIDPAQTLGALVLLGGTVAIIRGYRRKK
jgi:hypothetical protein